MVADRDVLRFSAGKSLVVDLSFSAWLFGMVRLFLESFTQRIVAWMQPSLREACDPSIRGKNVIITGPTSGIGLVTARELAAAGAHVVLACRRPKAGEELVAQWREMSSDLNTEVMELDLSSLASVRRFAAQWESRKQPLHILINNAGIALAREVPQMTADGHEEHLQMNFLAPLLLTLLLLPSLLRAEGARVVDVCSIGHYVGSLDTGDLNYASSSRKFWCAAGYSQSKLAQMLVTNALHRRLPSQCKLDIVAVHPGQVQTAMVSSYLAGLFPKLAAVTALLKLLMGALGLTPEQGACGLLYCATQPGVQQYARRLRERELMGGPYYTWTCRPSAVARHARSLAAGEQLLDLSLQNLGLPIDYVESNAFSTALT